VPPISNRSPTLDLDPHFRADSQEWNPRVLVVDDDELSRLAAVGLLETLGLAADVAHDGREALEVTAEWPYVAIFMDCAMPEVDGYTAARQLRNRENQDSPTPVIAVTSHQRSVSIASGMDHHLTKPLQLDQLRADCARLGLLPRDAGELSRTSAPRRLDTPLLDPSIFEQIKVATRVRLAKTAMLLIEETTARLPELWRATNTDDRSAIRRLAPTLGQRAARVGAARVSALCERVSVAPPEEATATVAYFERQLRRALRDTAAALEAYTDGTHVMGGSPVPKAASADVRPATDALAAGPVRVAFADDDPLARIAIGAMLDRAAWLRCVGDAASVDGIVELAALKRPDVVLLDWMLPGGGGREAARRILDHDPDTLIVALTSSDSQVALAEMTSAGASCLVAKGGSADQLTQTIRRALKAAATARAAENGKRSARRGFGSGMGVDNASAGAGALDGPGVERLQAEFGSSGVLAELVELFGSQAPERLASMRTGIGSGDSAAVGNDAHQLKGSCLTLAANGMADLCSRLELLSGGGLLEGAIALVEQIEAAFTAAQVALLAEVT
jgi:CheY-like chemotaxis protein